MKLKNKKTGEVIDYYDGLLGDREVGGYGSLAELTADWEDYEKPKEYWCIDWTGGINQIIVLDDTNVYEKNKKEIGNYFDTQEEAEKAVEKLKALKRLKDKGFRFEGIKQDYTRFFSQQKPMRIGRKYLQFNKAEDEEWLKENWGDLDLLFGGEE